MVTTKTKTHAGPPLGSRWAQMWAYMWAETIGNILVYVTKGNISFMTYNMSPAIPKDI